ncbi:MAG TPA: protease inhibitor I42 family protein [Gammaproteobacteria bacterium]|nr:protease inhibitor I42 family protein [Gammaproteobacteria bacterium]
MYRQSIKLIIQITSLFFLFILPAYADQPVIYDQSKTAIIVTKKKPIFIIKMISNPTTGYTWLLRDYDKTLIIPVKQQYVAPSKNLVGAPGYELWTFRVKDTAFVVPQRTTIEFIYARPWEQDKEADKSQYVITINDD